MSTSSEHESEDHAPWISQAEAARLRGVSRQAIHKMVQSGRLRSLRIAGHVLVSRQDLKRIDSHESATDKDRSMLEAETLIQILEPEVLHSLVDECARRFGHPIEQKLGASREVILDALERAGELTLRMFRGVIAEASFGATVLRPLVDWKQIAPTGNNPHDFEIDDGKGRVRIQVKLQRSERGQPLTTTSGHYVVETQRTRGGVDRTSGERTRPYRYSDFDILAVCLQPSTGRWDQFRCTTSSRLQPDSRDSHSIATFQPVSASPDADWSDTLLEAIEWLRNKRSATIQGETRRVRQSKESVRDHTT